MKKILCLFVLMILIYGSCAPVLALNVGTYKTETEYGLLDGFKFNWQRTDKSTPFVEPRKESTKNEKEREYQNYKDTEYERTKYMYDGKSII